MNDDILSQPSPEEPELPEEPAEEVEHEQPQGQADWLADVDPEGPAVGALDPVGDVAEPQVAGPRPAELSDIEMRTMESAPVSDIEMRTMESVPVSDVEMRTMESAPVSDVEVRTLESAPMGDVEMRTMESAPVSDVEVRTLESAPMGDVEMRTLESAPVSDVEMRTSQLKESSPVPSISQVDAGMGASAGPVISAPGFGELGAEPPDFSGVPQGEPLREDEPKFFRPHNTGGASTVEHVNFEGVQAVSEQEDTLQAPELAPPAEVTGLELPEESDFEEPTVNAPQGATPQDRVFQNASQRREARRGRMGFQGVVEEADFGRMEPQDAKGGGGELAQILTVLQEIASKLDALVASGEERSQALSEISAKIENVGGLT